MLVSALRRRVGQPGGVRVQVDDAPVEDPQLREQLIRAGIQPVHLLAAGPGGVGQYVASRRSALASPGYRYHAGRQPRRAEPAAGDDPDRPDLAFGLAVEVGPGLRVSARREDGRTYRRAAPSRLGRFTSTTRFPRSGERPGQGCAERASTFNADRCDLAIPEFQARSAW